MNNTDAGTAKAISTHFNVQTQNSTGALGKFSIKGNLIIFCTNGTTTLVEFKNWLTENPVTVVYELKTPIIEDIECSNIIVQYNEETMVYNNDEAETELSLTNNKAISEVNENIKNVKESIRVENISNENGTSIKFPDGTMIFHGKIYTENYTIANATSIKVIKFPVSFVGGYSAIGNAAGGNGKAYFVQININSQNECQVMLKGQDATNATQYISTENREVFVMAIGRWK